MTTFAERKATRIAASAAGAPASRFTAVASFPYAGECFGNFASRAEANAFAFDQIGPEVGNTRALHAAWRAHPGDFPCNIEFTVRRIED
jgi:hypothetical protein